MSDNSLYAVIAICITAAFIALVWAAAKANGRR